MQNQLKDSNVPLYKVEGLTLSVLSKEDVNMLSVTCIDEDNTYKENGDPVTHGINDDLMGTMDRDRLCKTCMGSQVDCPGHFGHIRLAQPVFHGDMLDYVRKVLRMVCCKCSHLLADQPETINELKVRQNLRNPKHRFNEMFKLCSNIKICHSCQTINHKYRKGALRIEYEVQDSSMMTTNDPKQILWPEEAKKILDKISLEHLSMIGLNKTSSNPSNMIIEDLAVAPPPVRPSVAMTNTMRSEDDLTVAYKQIIKQNNEIRRAIQAGNNDTSIKDLRKMLQFFVATLMNNDIKGAGTQKHKTGKPIKAIRARLKGKEGRLRGNLMGKRVDFSARTVITPDPNLRLDQLGVPIEIAMNLTVPEIVSEHNQAYLRTLVERGANNWPGAKYIKQIDGRYIDLSELANRSDQHLEIGYTVERHLKDDDYVIFNRQPSLHRMSLMGHRVKVLRFQTFRLNLSVTTPYNADFDGDEMNMHVPQSYETKAEVKEIMAVPRQIVAPKDNKPCMGIVQDSLLGIYRLTKRDTFLDKAAVMNLLMWVDYDLERGLPAPALLKPRPLWTGKQMLSLVIPQTINLEKGGDAMDRKDKAVCIQQGELLAGILNKGVVGSAAGGLIHTVWKDLGPQACCDILSNIQYVVNNWLVTTGFTVGVADIIAKPSIVKEVNSKITMYKKKVRKIINKTQYGRLQSQPGKSTMESFEHEVNKKLNNARDTAGTIALEALASDNRLNNMVVAGSKGGPNNISQIMACVGQQNVEGKRIQFGFSQRSLPHFTKNDYGPESKGFVSSSYLTGLTPSEFYFHAMGGREGLIDTAVKTADTGYIQRRLIKALEDLMVKYDGTVRTSREVLIHFLYGEDGMMAEHFEQIPYHVGQDNASLDKHCNFLHNIAQEHAYEEKLASAVGKERAQEILNDTHVQQLFQKEFAQLRDDRDLLRNDVLKLQCVRQDFNNGKAPIMMPMPVNLPRIITNVKRLNNIKQDSVSDLDPHHYFAQMEKLQKDLCVIPQCRLGVEDGTILSEAHQNSLMLFKIFLRKHLCAKKIIVEDRFDTIAFDQLIRQISEVFRAAMVNPGEMVGCIGAQSMGEPATQMTLNTFHSAGIASMNVTLGVPRLKEVINVAKQIKTPSLKIFLDQSIEKNQKEAFKVGDQIQYTNLASLVSDWGIYYDPDPNSTIIKEDKELIELYKEVEEMNGYGDQAGAEDEAELSRWVLRFKIDNDPSRALFNDNFEFRRDVVDRIQQVLCGGEPGVMQIVSSEDTSDTQVIRIRPYGMRDAQSTDVVMTLRELADGILNKITLRGFEKITKVFYTSNSNDCKRNVFDRETGSVKKIDGIWIIETDGVDLLRVFSVPGVDATKTLSNHIIEILEVLGIEAARNSLIRELRNIFATYSIYVNYRHLATLVDVMTQRGIFTSITRHGINRVHSGPLRKCSFEQTTEILLDAAFFGEHDTLTGITENVIFGQLAPYGTGSVDIIMDQEALLNCNERPSGGLYQNINQMSDEHTPMQEDDHMLTPRIEDTPAAGMYGATGATSVHVPSHDINFTPKYQVGGMSPASPGYGMMTPGANDSSRYSPFPQKSSAYGNGSSPMYSYGQSPAYGSSGIGGGNESGDGAAQGGAYNYSPAVGGLSSSPSYSSPSSGGGMGGSYQSPAYSPTTPSYHQNMAPIQHSTNTYAYGGPSSNQPAYQMPNISSPSQSPVARQTQGTGAAYGGQIYGQGGAYPASPAYSGPPNNAAQSQPSRNVYDPEQAVAPAANSGSAAHQPVKEEMGNSDSSDSEK